MKFSKSLSALALVGASIMSIAAVKPNSAKAASSAALSKDSSLGPGYYSQSTIDKANATKAEANAMPISGVATVNYKPGYGIALWSQPGTQLTGRYLPTGSKWRVFKYTTINGQRWYNLGGDQWISAQYSVLNTGNEQHSDMQPQRPQNIRTISEHGTLRINYLMNQSVNVYSAPGANATGKHLPNNTYWKYYKVAKYNGQDWYNLGGNQWVLGQYIQIPGNPENSVIRVNKVVTINYKPGYGIAVWNTPGGKPTGKYLPTGTKWKVNAQIDNGFLWYQVGTNQWIPAMYTYNG